MNFFSSLKPAFFTKLFLTLLCGVIYPFFMWGVGALFFHRDAKGSLYMYKDGKVIGSSLIAQNFGSEKYFHPRPSSAGNGYDASNSSPSNLGPTSQKLIDTLKQRATDYRAENKLSQDALIPSDAVTASGSGLDPHISIANAHFQAPRVAAARGIAVDAVMQAIEAHTKRPTWGFLGTARVHVLALNLALDQQDHPP